MKIPVVSDDFCACVFQGMLVEGPPGPEGPTVSQSLSNSDTRSLSLLTSYLVFFSCPVLITAITLCNVS